ncbi:hypothetical protein GCM10022210_55980 [Mucilaginibacter dorajii]|uniref:Lipocalin-like domain-containing protein n=2 Tax=Mucilaginibacter dorajii TaxID=692994 RepID=A0ABP7R9V4_9SPHI
MCCLSACKKDNEGATPAPTIVGKWFMKSHRIQHSKNNMVIADKIRTDYLVSDFEFFNDDGTGYTSNSTSSGTVAIIQYRYTLNGIRLKINRDTPTFYAGNYTVVSLTADSLAIHYESASVIDGDSYRGIEEIVLSKK